MSACFAVCEATPNAGLAVVINNRCICMEATTTFANPFWKLKNNVTGKVMELDAVGQPILVKDEADDDKQKW